MKRKIETISIFIILFTFLIMMLSSTKSVMESITFSINLWINNLVPSLFPFLIISKLLINYGVTEVLSEITIPILSNRLNIRSKCNYLIILSLFSGFPSSSIYIRDAYINNEIDKKEMELLLSICFFSNPLFIIGTIGLLLLNNIKVGIYILVSHYLSNFIYAYIKRSNIKTKEKINIRQAFSKMKNKIFDSRRIGIVIKNTVTESVNTLFLLLGIISIFIIISNLLLKNLPESIESILNGILEMTGGIKKVSLLNIHDTLKYLIIVFLLSFGGISIHIQILSILNDIKINYKKFILTRIIISIIAVIILYIIIKGEIILSILTLLTKFRC